MLDRNTLSKLLEKRAMYLGEINDENASLVVAQLLFLEKESSTEDVTLYINSTGGSVTAGFAIYDTIRHVKCDVATIGLQQVGGMAAFILAAGKKGKRSMAADGEVVLAPIISNIKEFNKNSNKSVINKIWFWIFRNGKASQNENDKYNKQILSVKNKMSEIWSQNTGQPLDVIKQDMEMTKYLDPDMAKDYGIVDTVLKSPSYEALILVHNKT